MSAVCRSCEKKIFVVPGPLVYINRHRVKMKSIGMAARGVCCWNM